MGAAPKPWSNNPDDTRETGRVKADRRKSVIRGVVENGISNRL
jgi:hypothetical protein